MPTFRYSVFEYDPSRPWVIVGSKSGLTVQLPQARDFHDWVRDAWPRDRYSASLDPGQVER